VRVQLGPRKLAGVVMDVVPASEIAPEKLQTIVAAAAIPRVPDDVLDMVELSPAITRNPWAWPPRWLCHRRAASRDVLRMQRWC
jgi:hypothetical protein